MEHFFVGFFQSHFEVLKHWGIPVMFAVAFLESLPFIGAILPGQLLIIFGGFLVKSGFFSFGNALMATALGAILADVLGFYAGKYFGPQIKGKKIWLLEKSHVEKAVNLIENNSVKSIFIGRFHSFTRAFMPFAAGMSNIKIKKFLVIDIITAFFWALLSLSIGFVFGKSFEVAASFVGKFVLITTFIAIIVIAAISHMKVKGSKIASLDAVLVGISATFLYLFTITAYKFANAKFFHILDIKMQFLASGINDIGLTWLMICASTLGGPVVLPVLLGLFIIWLISKSRFGDGIFTTITLGLGIVILNMLKALFERTRPYPGLVLSSGSSFPSGHAMIAVIVAIVLYFVALRKIKKDSLRTLATSTVFLCALVIGLSRVYLNVHWASDVLGGFFFGGFFATFAILAYRLFDKIFKNTRTKGELPDIP